MLWLFIVAVNFVVGALAGIVCSLLLGVTVKALAIIIIIVGLLLMWLVVSTSVGVHCCCYHLRSKYSCFFHV